MDFPSRRRRPLLLLGLTALAIAAMSFTVGTRFLRGSVQTEIALEDRVVAITDSDGDHAMTAREMRRAIGQTFRKMGQNNAAYNLDDTGTVDRDDVRILIRVLRAFLTAVCGNTVRDAGEQCDDGNGDTTDDCTNKCKNAVCGDGTRWNGREQCDDGNAEERDHCSKLCIRTKNWWIDEHAIPGPISPLPDDSRELMPSTRIVTPLGDVVQFWYTEWQSSFQVFGQENASVYRAGSWSETVNPFQKVFPGKWTRFGTSPYEGRIVVDREGRVFAFYSMGEQTIGGSFIDVDFGRATYENGAWRGERLPILGVAGGNVIGWKIDEDNRGLVLFSGWTDIASDLRNHPIFGSKLANYRYDPGLFAVAYNDGAWGTPVLLQTMYHTAAWQNVAKNNGTLGRIDYPPIMPRVGTSYVIQWYEHVTFDIGAP